MSLQTTLPLMTTKSMVESAWAEDMGHFLYHVDPDTRKITRRLEKLQLKIIKCSIFFKVTCLNKSSDRTKQSVCGRQYAPPWGLSSLAKELPTAASVMQSSSKELSTPVADRV